MTIKEVEQQTGLSRSNIRFYEKEQLVDPARNDTNGYREYSAADVEAIKKIAFLRGLDISVEDIRRLVKDECGLDEILNKKAKQLEAEMERLQQAKIICRQMLEAGEHSFRRLDIGNYIGSLETYVRQNRFMYRLDTVPFLQFWGGFPVWAAITVLCFAAAALSIRFLPDRIPVQWNGAQATNLVNRWFIFAYGGACILIRFLLRPYIGKWLSNKGFYGRTITEYIVNFLCFTFLSVELFTLLYVFHLADNVTDLLGILGAGFGGALLLGMMNCGKIQR